MDMNYFQNIPLIYVANCSGEPYLHHFDISNGKMTSIFHTQDFLENDYQILRIYPLADVCPCSVCYYLDKIAPWDVWCPRWGINIYDLPYYPSYKINVKRQDNDKSKIAYVYKNNAGDFLIHSSNK